MDMLRLGAAFAMVIVAAQPAHAQGAASAQREAMLARAKAAELPGRHEPPPGDILSHQAGAYANLLCNQIFVSGFDPDFARATLGDANALAPLSARIRMDPPVVDRAARAVRVRVSGGVTREARMAGGQGCVLVPEGASGFAFLPRDVERRPALQSGAPWPLGDAPDTRPAPAGMDAAKLAAAVEAAFRPDGLTQGFIVAHDGRIVAERYGPQAGPATPLEGFSMGKSVIATLVGVLVRDGALTLDQPAPIPAWRAAGDPRGAIRVRDLLNMSSGLRVRAEQDPDFQWDGTYPAHWYFYTAPDAVAWGTSRPPQWPPATVGRYRNSDPLLLAYIVRRTVEARGRDPLAFPQTALFDPLGIATATLETDAHGNFLTQGYEQMSARDWTRLGQLYLQDGVWAGRRLLPEGYASFVSTVAPAWAADGRPIYGGLFWVNGDGDWPVPKDAYYMAGAGGQYVFIIPSHGLVVTRLGRYAGSGPGTAALRRALTLIIEATPAGR